MRLGRLRRAIAKYRRRKRKAHRAGSRFDRLIMRYLKSKEITE